MLSHPDLGPIALRAASLQERVALAAALTDAPPAPSGVPARDTAADPDVTSVLRAWQQAFAPGDPAALARRLRWDGLDADTIDRALRVTDNSLVPLPEWTGWLDRIAVQAVRVADEWTRGPLADADELRLAEDPLKLLWLPAVRVARDTLREQAQANAEPLSDEVRLAFERQWLGELAGLGTLATRKSHADTDPLDLLRQGLAPLWRAWPVLARQVALVTGHAAGAAAELVTRLARDRAAIAATFHDGIDPGPLVAIAPALSDPHDRRRRAAALRFASGLRLLYKPRDLRLERRYNELLAWTAGRGLHPAPIAIEVLPRDGYGWVEFVADSACGSETDVREAFRRAGSLLCLTWLLGGRDLHVENVIATQHGPVLIDTEMLLQPAGSLLADVSEGEPNAGRPRGSCLETGLLTWLHSSDAGVIDIGGLCGNRGLRNRIRLHDEPQQPAAFAEDIASGFIAAYDLLHRHRDELLADNGPLSAIAECRARIAFRPSGHYASVHQVLSTPAFQRSGVMRSCALDSLSRLFNTDRERPRLWPLVSAERLALDTLDVPRFSIGVDDTIVDQGREVGPLFARSGLAAARERLAQLSDTDLAWHLATLRDVLTQQTSSRFTFAPPAESADTRAGDARGVYLDHARWIGQELLERARERDNALTWPLHRWQLAASADAVDACDLYSGALGPALFFAALASVTRDGQWIDATRATLTPVRRWIDRRGADGTSAMLGIGSGLGSLVYGLTAIGVLLDGSDELDLAHRVATGWRRDRIIRDRALDLISGTSGALLSLLTLRRHVDDPRLDQLMAVCADHLVATQVDGADGGWSVLDGCVHTGFAHGASGIAYALLRAFERTGRLDCLHAAGQGHRCERALYAPQRGEWPLLDVTTSPLPRVAAWMTAWCHGAPGIALARGLTRHLVDDVATGTGAEAEAELQAALAGTLARRFTPFDSLCCGNFGRIDVLLTLGARLQRPELIAAAQDMTSAAIERARRRAHWTLTSSGFEHRVFDPGFFQGLSGIGYQLLRLAEPARLPSVLAFEAVDARAALAQPHAHPYRGVGASS